MIIKAWRFSTDHYKNIRVLSTNNTHLALHHWQVCLKLLPRWWVYLWNKIQQNQHSLGIMSVMCFFDAALCSAKLRDCLLHSRHWHRPTEFIMGLTLGHLCRLPAFKGNTVAMSMCVQKKKTINNMPLSSVICSAFCICLTMNLGWYGKYIYVCIFKKKGGGVISARQSILDIKLKHYYSYLNTFLCNSS